MDEVGGDDEHRPVEKVERVGPGAQLHQRRLSKRLRPLDEVPLCRRRDQHREGNDRHGDDEVRRRRPARRYVAAAREQQPGANRDPGPAALLQLQCDEHADQELGKAHRREVVEDPEPRRARCRAAQQHRKEYDTENASGQQAAPEEKGPAADRSEEEREREVEERLAPE
jgi:hypothetical protein